MYDAIILAGGENKTLRQFSEQRYEALIEIAGRPMVSYVAEALTATGEVGRIFAVGPAAELKAARLPAGTVTLEGGETIMDTIRIGMAALGHQKPVLVATADLPLLTADAVADFITHCRQWKADLYYPIVSREVNDARYPGNRRTYVRLREGTFTGGNLFMVNPAIVEQCVTEAEKIIANRKRPFRLCQLLGWSFVLRFALGRLNLADCEQRVSELLGIRGRVFESAYPELGLDVDKPSDLELVRKVFSVQARLNSI